MMNKASIHQECIREVNKRLEEVDASIQRVQESIENEEGSTAGNKFETARAMSQSEMERLLKQQVQLINLLKGLKQIDPSVAHTEVQIGSLVKVDNWICYLAGPLGLIKPEGNEIRVISLASPLGQMLQHKKKSERIHFQNKEMTITDLW